MEIGETWAYRAKPRTDGEPVIPAVIRQFGPPKSQKVRVEFLAGEFAGLDHWIARRCLLVPWSEAPDWLRDEQRLQYAREQSVGVGDTLEYQATELVFAAYPRADGLLLGYQRKHGNTVMVTDIETTARDLDLDGETLLREPFAFIDRHGIYIAPWSVAYHLARRVAEVYPELVLATVAGDERDLHVRSLEVAATGLPWEVERASALYADELRQMKPIHDLVRSWCGADEAARFDAVEALRAEVLRLRALVEDAARQLESFRHPRIARDLRRRLEEINR